MVGWGHPKAVIRERIPSTSPSMSSTMRASVPEGASCPAAERDASCRGPARFAKVFAWREMGKNRPGDSRPLPHAVSPKIRSITIRGGYGSPRLLATGATHDPRSSVRPTLRSRTMASRGFDERWRGARSSVEEARHPGHSGRAGSPGGLPPGLPQIRTCGFPASGSSSQDLATYAAVQAEQLEGVSSIFARKTELTPVFALRSRKLCRVDGCTSQN